MTRIIPGFSLVLSLVLLAACTQSPAMVELKGQNTYSRNTYALNTPAPAYSYGKPPAAAANAYTTTTGTITQTASIQPINVQELAALSPAAGSAAPRDTPFAVAAPQKQVAPAPAITPLMVTSASSATEAALPSLPPLNGVASKPLFSDTESDADVPQLPAVSAPSQTKPIAQLDQLIGNEGDNIQRAKPATAKMVKVETTAFMWPVNGKKIISGFGPKGDGKTNDGINIAAGEGEPVWASADGEIVYVGNELQGYGNMVLIKHAGNKTTAYAHLSRAIVDKYDRVKQGDIIGYVGTTGNVKESQLHFAIRDGKDPIDPMKYLTSNVASN